MVSVTLCYMAGGDAMRFIRNVMSSVMVLGLPMLYSPLALAGDCDWCVCKGEDTVNSCKPCCSPGQNVGGSNAKDKMVEGLGLGGRKLQVIVQKDGKAIYLPIAKWETGAVITRDDKTGLGFRQEFKYPIIDYLGYEISGDNSLCWQMCKDACDGVGVCHSVCWWKCASEGSAGDPIKN